KDGNEKEMSVMDRYFQRLFLEDKRKLKKNAVEGPGKSDASPGDLEEQDDSGANLPESVRETHRNLKKHTEDRAKKELATDRHSNSGFFSDIFALERKKPTLEEERIEKERLDAYRRSL